MWPGSRLICAIGGILLASAVLAGCGTVDSIRGNKGSASNDAEAVAVKPEDPLARPIQVGWTSARASHCGFIFDPVRLKANFLASEQASGVSPEQMKKIEQAYDYTLSSVTSTIKDDLSYCNKDRTDAIRADLNRYLAGDFSVRAQAGK